MKDSLKEALGDNLQIKYLRPGGLVDDESNT